MKSLFTILIFLALALPKFSFSQDTITFLNGKVAICKVISSDSATVNYSIEKGKKTKQKWEYSDQVYDIHFENGTIDTLYQQDSTIGNYFTPLEMHYFILGEQDAREIYKPRVTAAIGFVVGVGAGYALADQFYVAAVPMAYTLIAAVTRVPLKGMPERSTAIIQHPAYQEGFIKIARLRKSVSAFISSLAGTIAGIGIGYATN